MPWAANLATLAVVVATIGWSSGQRPGPVSVEATAARPAAAPVVPVADQSPAAQPGVTQANWPVKTSALGTDGLQTVVYAPGKLR